MKTRNLQQLKKLQALLLLLLLTTSYGFSQLVTYPGPGNNSVKSDKYRVWVRQPGGTYEEQYVYIARNEDTPNTHTHSYVQFSYSGKVDIKVEKISTNANSVIVRPKRYGLSANLSGKTATFQINSNSNKVNYINRLISVEYQDADATKINGHGLAHGLLIFANPLENGADVPNPNGSNVHKVTGNSVGNVPSGKNTVYFTTGFHSIGSWNVPSHVKHVYIPGGAFLKGSMKWNENNSANIKLNGRGVLSGINNGDTERTITWGSNGSSKYIEGIAIPNSQSFHQYNVANGDVKRLKCISYGTNSDGFGVADNTTVTECFMHCDDDAFRSNGSNYTITNCVIWHDNNGACFQMGWNSWTQSNNTVKHIDVIHHDAKLTGTPQNKAVFNARLRQPGNGVQSNFLFEDIVVETKVNQIFDCQYADKHTLRNFTFKNWDCKQFTLNEASNAKNKIGSGVENMKFINLKINGVKITNSNKRSAGQFFIDNGADVSFIQNNTAEYTISASAGANGSISPSGNIVVSSGSNQSFTITPNTGYVVNDVLVNGNSQGAITSYTFNNVTSNKTISATFKPDNQCILSDITDLAATQSNCEVTLTWTDQECATEYIVRRKTNGGVYENIGNVTAPASSFVDVNVSDGNSYLYQVRPFDGTTKMVSNNPTIVMDCSQPCTLSDITDLAATQNNCEVTLTWTDQECATEYIVRRKTNGGAYENIGNVAAPSSSFVDANVSDGNSYLYQVRPFDGTVKMVSNNPTIVMDCSVPADDYIFIDHNSSTRRLKGNSDNSVVTQTGGTGDFTQWQEEPTSNGYFYLVHKATGDKLNSSDGTAINLVAASNTNNNVQWKWIDAGSGWYRLENRQYTKWLHVKPDGVTDLILGPTNWTGDNTKWKYTAVPKAAKESIANNDAMLQVYPNPAKDLVTIYTSELTDVEFYNIQGQLVHTLTVDGQTEISVNTIGEPGLYFMSANGLIKKLIIQ